MKHKSLAFSRTYRLALKKCFDEPGIGDGKAMALKLGIRAFQLGLTTNDIAKIHEDSLLSLIPLDTSALTRGRLIREGIAFFARTCEAIEERRSGNRTPASRLESIIATLAHRTSELAVSNAKLRSEVTQRRVVEKSLRASEVTTSQLLKRSRHMQEELRHLSRRLLSVQEEERKRISRELHDVVAQALNSINVRLALLATQTTARAADVQKKIAATQRIVEKSVDVVHRFARDLRPSVLDDLGLIPALKSYLKTFQEDSGIVANLDAFTGVERLGSEVKTAMYRIAQESLANVVRHAKASHVGIRIFRHKANVCMEIQDDGRGFQASKTEGVARRKHLGLLGMRERIEMVRGTFKATSIPGQQTTILVEVPMHAPPKRSLRPKLIKP